MTRSKFLISGVIVAALVVAGALLFPQECCASVQGLTPAQYQTQFSEGGAGHLLVDVRTPAEYAGGHIPNAVNIPLDSLQSRLDEIPQGQPVVVYCRSGNRSAAASQILTEAGYSEIYDMGGIIAWSAAGLPVE